MGRRGTRSGSGLLAFLVLLQAFGAPPAHARGATARTVPGMRQVLDVWCRPGGTCVGVGHTGQQGAVVLLGAAGPIGPVHVVGGTTYLVSVVCTGSGSCLAVGKGPSSAVVVGLAGDGTPGAVRPAGVSSLLDVACSTATTCVAVGLLESGSDVYPHSNPTPFYVVITNGQPGRPRTLPAGTSPLITGIACPTATKCLAVGQGSLVALSNVNGAWSATLARHPNSWAGTAVPSEDISCPSPTVCYVTADDAIATPEGWLGVPAMIQVSIDGVAQPAQRLSTRPGLLHAISCVAVGTCTLVGQDAVTSQGQSFHVVGGALRAWLLWGNSNYMSGVSCTAAQSCGLAGSMPLYGVFGPQLG